MLNLLCLKSPHYCSRTIRSLIGIAFVFILLFPCAVFADEFGIMVVPSLMDSDMDAWYRVPHNSGPVIHDASDVTVGQPFNLLVFFMAMQLIKTNRRMSRMTFKSMIPMENRPTIMRLAWLLTRDRFPIKIIFC